MPRLKSWRSQLTSGDLPVKFNNNEDVCEIIIGQYNGPEIENIDNTQLILQIKIDKKVGFDTKQVIDINCGSPMHIKQPSPKDCKAFKYSEGRHYRFIVMADDKKILAGPDSWHTFNPNKDKNDNRKGVFATHFDLDGEQVWDIKFEPEPILRLNKKFKNNNTIQNYIKSIAVPKFIREVITERKKHFTLALTSDEEPYWIQWHSVIKQLVGDDDFKKLDETEGANNHNFIKWLDNLENKLCKEFKLATFLLDNIGEETNGDVYE